MYVKVMFEAKVMIFTEICSVCVYKDGLKTEMLIVLPSSGHNIILGCFFIYEGNLMRQIHVTN